MIVKFVAFFFGCLLTYLIDSVVSEILLCCKYILRRRKNRADGSIMRATIKIRNMVHHIVASRSPHTLNTKLEVIAMNCLNQIANQNSKFYPNETFT